ncbi:heparan sulfate 3-O sulfotransferase-A isoform 1-T14 [Cochliomyia hominivorax]
MTTAKRRTGNSATFVADSNHHYSSLDQQQQQQQQHQQNQHQQQSHQQQQFYNQNHYNQQQQQNNHENQRLLQQEPTTSSNSNTIQRHFHHQQQQHYPNYNSTNGSGSSATASSSSTAAHSNSSSSSSSSAAASIMRGECSVKLPLDILWLPKSAMRPVGPDASHTDCILVVGVSRPKLAVVFLTVMLISLFLTFHVLYDSAVYNIQAAQAVHEHHHHRLALMSANSIGHGSGAVGTGGGSSISSSLKNINANRANHLPEDYGGSSSGFNNRHPNDISSSNQQISHPMVFPSNRVHFPKTSRRLPQALIIGIRKCGTRALLEMLYLHPRIQKAGGEVHFFDRDENYMKGLEWYRKKMPHSFRGQITIEKSPSYFVSPEVPERVRAMNASIKLLLIVREPVTRAISDYTQLRSHAATATLPLANEQQQQLQQQPITSSSSASALSGALSSSVNMVKMSSHSMLYNKLNAGYSSSQVYDNSLGGGGGIGRGSGNGNNVYGSGAGGIKTNFKNPYNSHRHYETTTASPQTNVASSTAQILSKSFEELAIFPNGTVNESYRPLSISMYHLHLHRWLEVFPREQILIVNGDRLIDDPVSQLKKIESFLGIEHRITSNHFYFNETKGFYCLRYDSGDRCLRETKGRKHPHVDPVVISKLRKFFAEHNQRFYELVGEDLGWPEE